MRAPRPMWRAWIVVMAFGSSAWARPPSIDEVLNAYRAIRSVDAEIEYSVEGRTERVVGVLLADGRFDVRTHERLGKGSSQFRLVQRVNRDQTHLREVGRTTNEYAEVDAGGTDAWSDMELRMPWARVAAHIERERSANTLRAETRGDRLVVALTRAEIEFVFEGEGVRLVSARRLSTRRLSLSYGFGGFVDRDVVPQVPTTIEVRVTGLTDLPGGASAAETSLGRIVSILFNVADAENRVNPQDLITHANRRDLATGDVFGPDGRLLFNERELDEKIRAADNPRRRWRGWLAGAIGVLVAASLIVGIRVSRRKGRT